MGIGKIWDIVWQNEPFHWATAFVLAIAIIIELVTLWEYWHDADFSKTEAAIKFLSNLPKNPDAQESKIAPV